jgi:hypothetical protein
LKLAENPLHQEPLVPAFVRFVAVRVHDDLHPDLEFVLFEDSRCRLAHSSLANRGVVLDVFDARTYEERVVNERKHVDAALDGEGRREPQKDRQRHLVPGSSEASTGGDPRRAVESANRER